MQRELETQANVIQVLSAEKEAAIEEAHSLRESNARLQAANDLLDDQIPKPDQVVIPRADYEALIKALPATSPGLRVVHHGTPSDGPEDD